MGLLCLAHGQAAMGNQEHGGQQRAAKQRALRASEERELSRYFYILP
jgi:hypothetical protein